MHYEFPRIEKWSDVEKYVTADHFRVTRKNGYFVVTYGIADGETFPPIGVEGAEIRREFRGLTFSDDGRLISRKFHKFFNLGEREETKENVIDWNLREITLEKLDGSMIVPVFVNGELQFHTKAGETDVSKACWKKHGENESLKEFCRKFLNEGVVPIFEWISPENRIVVEYDEDELILLAMREMVTGDYIPVKDIRHHAERYGIPVVGELNVSPQEVKKLENMEGIVVKFSDGHMLKVKGDWYVRIHTVKDDIGNIVKLAMLIVTNSIDDLLPVLPENDVKKIHEFEKELVSKIQGLEHLVNDFYDKHGEKERKEYAMAVKSEMPELSEHLFARLRTEHPVFDALKKACETNSRTKVKNLLTRLGLMEENPA